MTLVRPHRDVFSRQHYEVLARVLHRELEIAEALGDLHRLDCVKSVVRAVADELDAVNVNFNRKRFLAACGDFMS